jgi:hypothetical protein
MELSLGKKMTGSVASCAARNNAVSRHWGGGGGGDTPSQNKKTIHSLKRHYESIGKYKYIYSMVSLKILDIQYVP